MTRALLPRPTVSAIVVMGLAAVLVTWLATRGGSGSSRTVTPAPAAAPATTAPAPRTRALGPLALSEGRLRTVVASLGQPVYWVGPEPGRRYELRRTTAGDVFLRYLPLSVRAGDPRALRTIGTYPVASAYTDTQALAKQAGSVYRKIPGGWLAVYRSSRPTSVYLARPGLAYQIEVYDPSATAARQLARTALSRVTPG
jgi:hypothetical protein